MVEAVSEERVVTSMGYWSLHYRREGYTRRVGGHTVPEAPHKVLITPKPNTREAAEKLAAEYVGAKGQRSVGGTPATILFLGEYQS